MLPPSRGSGLVIVKKYIPCKKEEGALDTALRDQWPPSLNALRSNRVCVSPLSTGYLFTQITVQDDTEEKGWFVLQHESSTKLVWDIIMMALIIFSSFANPLHIGEKQEIDN